MKDVTRNEGRLPPPGVIASASGVAGQIKSVGQEVCEALRAVVERIPGKSQSTEEFARTLEVNRSIAGRLLRAVRTDDPLAAVNQMPRAAGLRIILEAARPAVGPELVDRAERALRALEGVVRRELGGWDGLEAAMVGWLPDVRGRFELSNRQLVYKGMANLQGMCAELQLDTVIYYPDERGERCDIAIIEGFAKIRRLRAGVRVPVAVVTPNPRARRPLPYTLEDVPIDGTSGNCGLLEEFCSRPCPELEAIETGEVTNFVLAGDSIGVHSARDVFAASVVRGARPLYRVPGEEPWRPHLSGGVNLPAKALLLNVLLHEDVWPDGEPQLLVYDSLKRGLASPDDPTSEFDRMASTETIQSLGKGVEQFRASEVGRHVEMVQHVTERLGWDATRLRGYRVRVQYPLLNAQYCVAFAPAPLRSEGG